MYATHVLPMGVGPFAFRYQGNGATSCQYIDTTRKAIDCAITLPLTVFVIIELFSLALTVGALQGKTCQDSLLSGEGRSLGAKISGEYFGFYKTRHIFGI